MTKLTPFDKEGMPASPVIRLVCTRAPHGVKPEIVVSIHPEGTIGLREKHRPACTEKTIEISALYVMLVQKAILKVGPIATALRAEGIAPARARRIARKEVGL